MWIHPEDAAARGISDGQAVRVFNNLGETLLPAYVTDRVARGAVAINEGTWHTLRARAADRGGNPNLVSIDRPSPCGAATFNTNLVEIAPLPTGR